MSANWKDFVKTADKPRKVMWRNPVTGLGYDRNGYPVFDFSKLPPPQKGTDAHQSVMSAAPDRPKVDYDKLRENIAMGGNGNPDEMLGKRMNPILIAPGMAAGGVPGTAMSAISQAMAAIAIAHGMEALSESHPTIAKTIAAANVGMTAAPFLTPKPVIKVPGRRRASGDAPDPYAAEPPQPSDPASMPVTPTQKALARMRAKIMSRVNYSDSMLDWEAGAKIPASDIKKYLLQQIRKGSITGRPKGVLKRLASDLDVDLNGRGDAFPLTSLKVRQGLAGGTDVRPKISVESDSDGFVPIRTLRHEFGHIADLHNMDAYSPQWQERLNSDDSALRVLFSGDRPNFETRANVYGGLPRRTPWIDTYKAQYAPKSELNDLLKRYPIRKPPLPQ